VPETSFRTIDELAERCGGYCWVEQRLFELTGAWAGEEADPGLRVFLSSFSRQHGLLAAEWYDRLPVRAGVDRAALVKPPAGPLEEAFDMTAAQPDLAARVAALLGSFLPQITASYGEDLAQASPVREGPVMAVLRRAHLLAAGHQECVSKLHIDARIGTEFARRVEHLFGGVTGVLPGARAS
jgi:hypothetical protein